MLEPKIHEVRCSSSESNIAIIINLIKDQYTILGWNVKKNEQICQYDVKKPFEILWDYKGCMYIAYKTNVIFTELSCDLKIYDFLEFSMQANRNHEKSINMATGIKFDGKNHNWLIFNEFIATPFCYLTFVIRDKIGEGNAKYGEVFDPEPFHYLFNKSSSLLDDKFVQIEHQKLDDILASFLEIDVDLLEILNYC